LAEEVCKVLARKRIQAEICGSIRRRADVVGDVDMVVSSPTKAVVEALKGFPKKVVATPNKNEKGYTFLIEEVQFDFYYSSPENWGAMVLFLTGSQLFNIILRGMAKRDGMKLSQYGLFHNGEVIAGRTERQIFDALGLEYVEPERRTLEKIPDKRDWPIKFK